MPRAFSWRSIMSWRGSIRKDKVTGKRGSGTERGNTRNFRHRGSNCSLQVYTAFLSFPLSYTQINGKYAGVVADRDERDVLIDVVFHLDYFLSVLPEIGQIRNREIIGNLLLDRQTRIGIAFGSPQIRIDFYAANPKQLLYPAAHCGIECLSQNGI